MTCLRLLAAQFALLLLACAVVAQDAEPVPEEPKPQDTTSYRLAWNISENDELAYRQVQTIDQDLFGSKVKNVNTTDYTLRCTGFTEKGGIKLEYTYDRIALLVESEGLNIDYDSAKPDPAELEKLPQLKGSAALAGKKFSYEVTLEWEVENLQGWDKVRELVLEHFDGAMREGIAPSFSDETRIDQLEAGLRCLPRKKVKIGDEWKNTYSEPAGEVGVLKYDMTLKLTGVETKDEQQFATITTTCVPSFEAAKEGPYAFMNPKVKEATLEQTDVFNMTIGAIHSQELKQTITMEYEMEEETLTHSMIVKSTVERLPDKKTEPVPDKPEPPKPD